MFLEKLFNKNKDKLPKYFLEIIDDDDNNEDASQESEKLEKPQPTAPTTSVETLTSDEEQLEPSKTEAKNASKTKAGKTDKKSSAPAPAPANVSYDPPEWVKAIKNYSDVSGNGDGNSGASLNNFAGKYVSNNVPSSRRRPGGSLNKFKDMASKVGK